MHIKTRYYILTVILSYLFFMMSSLPASKLVSLAEDNKLISAKLYGVYGSLWRGGAEQINIPNQAPITDLQWSLNPASLLIAKLSSEVNGNIKQQKFIGNIGMNALGTVEATDLRVRISSPVMQELIQMPLGELGGVFNINIESIILNDSPIPDITGTLKWNNAKLTIAETVDLGHINIAIKPNAAKQLTATISNTKGQLSLDGSASVDDKKQYTLDLRITPEQNAVNSITQSLSMFSRRQTDGSYLIKRKGNLREIGM